MLQENITNFLDYCNNSDFSNRSIPTLSFRLNEFDKFINERSISEINYINYQHLVQFIADYGQPSPSVKKARVWSLRQFFHYLKLLQLINKNIALELPYPKIEKKVALFLTADEFNCILTYFSQKTTDIKGLRNLIMILMMGLLGIRTAATSSLSMSMTLIWLKAAYRFMKKAASDKTKSPTPYHKYYVNYWPSISNNWTQNKRLYLFPNETNATHHDHCKIYSEMSLTNWVSKKNCIRTCSAIRQLPKLIKSPAYKLPNLC